MLAVSLVLLTTCSLARAADAPHAAPHGTVATTPSSSHAQTPAHVASRRPVIDAHAAPWAGATIILILGMFLAAAIVGPVVRYHAPEEAPEPSSHDDHGHDAHAAHGHH
ncbi:MAG: hypothetical protein WBD40_19145 [Tepidisphaeraceae bacterium]